jgi:predicted nucleic acid-binding protein
MPAFYLDASAIVKRYLPEPGTPWLNELLGRAGDFVFLSSELSLVEVISALSRAQRENRVSVAHRDRLINQVNAEMQALMRVVSASRLVVQAAGDLVVRHPLRAYDAVHLATAVDMTNALARLGMDAPVLISADAALLTAARAEGLRTENPNDHP